MKSIRWQGANGVFLAGVLGLFGALGFSSAASAQSYVFGRADFPTGTSPSAIAIGDFNGDGRLDLAVANLDVNNSTVSILLGKPDGTFLPKVDYVAGSEPGSLVVADFNGDGKLDLAVANELSNTISILLGNGDGTFQNHVDYATGVVPLVVAISDFNGDGKPDLAVTNQVDNTVSILLGNGDGTFQVHTDYATGNRPQSVSTGDFNRDGKSDLAVVNETDSTVSILLGNGDGTFQAHVDYATGSQPLSVAIGDFNADGKLDLAVTNSSDSTVSILLGNGDGTFRTHVDYATSFGFGPFSVIASDFNGDGKLDLAVGNNGSNTLSILVGNGDGTFRATSTMARFRILWPWQKVTLTGIDLLIWPSQMRVRIQFPSCWATATRRSD